jgi:hypothetical protein
MTDDRTPAGRAAEFQPAGRDVPGPAPATTPPPLTSDDVRRLTLYKWKYSLESSGFAADEIGNLLFLKWLHARGTVRG